MLLLRSEKREMKSRGRENKSSFLVECLQGHFAFLWFSHDCVCFVCENPGYFAHGLQSFPEECSGNTLCFFSTGFFLAECLLAEKLFSLLATRNESRRRTIPLLRTPSPKEIFFSERSCANVFIFNVGNIYFTPVFSVCQYFLSKYFFPLTFAEYFLFFVHQSLPSTYFFLSYPQEFFFS